MRPDDKKRTKVQTGVARARLLLKRDMGWLPGYPVALPGHGQPGEIQWQASTFRGAQLPASWSLTNEHLRRAQMTLTKLRHRFPRALPKVVDDVDDWLRRSDFVLELLKSAIHDGKSFTVDSVIQSGILPPRWVAEIGKLRSQYPALTRLLDAVTFLGLTGRQSPDQTQLQWIGMHVGELTELSQSDRLGPCELAIRLMSVRGTMSAGLLRNLTRCLTDPAVKDCQWERPGLWLTVLRDNLNAALHKNEFGDVVKPREATLGELILSTFDQICLARPRQQRGTFRLLEQLLHEGVLEHVNETQQKVADRGKRLQKLLRRIRGGHEILARTKPGREQLKQKVAHDADIRADERHLITNLGQSLCRLSQLPDSDVRLWTEFLETIPDDRAELRTGLLFKMLRNAEYAGTCRKDFLHVVRQLTAVLRSRGPAVPILKHWRAYVDGAHAGCEFITGTHNELMGKRQVATRTVHLLEKVIYDRQVDLQYKLLTSLVEFAVATDDIELSASLVERLAQDPDEQYCSDDIRLAVRFGDSIEDVVKILRTMEQSHEISSLATQLLPLTNVPCLKAIVAKRFVENRSSDLLRLGVTISVFRHDDQSVPQLEIITQSTAWIRHYPAQLHPSLIQLAEASPRAQQIAETILGKPFPSSVRLQQQIDSIKTRLAATSPGETDCPKAGQMRQRLGNLQRRLVEPDLVSPARLEKFVEKITERTEHEILERYTETCRKAATGSLATRFNLTSLPDDLFQPPLDRVLSQIDQLKKPMRQLGIRLLFETMARTTRNFDDEPANVAFRTRIEQAGVDMDPWLGDQTTHTATAADGTAYTLAFTRDVIDFLLMGFHFGTCLSPDSYNFFSTVANAVDLNKRVVYGKTATGRLIGRCLFVLSDVGKILTYHRYSHNIDDGFAKAVDEFASQLATSMKTSLTSVGNVPKLVAKQWYDDGAVGAVADDDSWVCEPAVLGQLLRKFYMVEVLPELLKVVDRRQVRQRIIQLVSDRRLCNEAVFLNAVLDEFDHELSFREKFTIAVNVESAGVSDRLLSQIRWHDVVRLLSRNQCQKCDVFHGIATYQAVFSVLIGYNPTLALRAIHAARPSSIRDDVDDPNPIRRAALAEAHRKLGRQQLAEKLVGDNQ